MMTEELKSELKAAHEDEVHDIHKYNRMAEALCAAGCEKGAKVLRDIAKDEESHAKYLAEIMKWGK